MVLFARCKEILEEVTQAKIGDSTWDILNWTHISINVAIGFLSYLYGGIFNLHLNSFDEWEQAKLIGQKYSLNLWNNYVESLKDCCDQPSS